MYIMHKRHFKKLIMYIFVKLSFYWDYISLANQCPPIALSPGVVANCTDGNFVGSNCTFSCGDEGTLLGNEYIYCKTSTVWSGKSPYCRSLFNFFLSLLLLNSI